MREKLEFPPISALSDAHVGGGARRIADLMHTVPLIRAASVAMSITNQRCSKCRSAMTAPMQLRTTLLAPSQPKT